MQEIAAQRHTREGFTLFEVTFTAAMLLLLLTAIFSAVIGLQNAAVEGVTVSDLTVRAERALDRVVELASQAVTEDAIYSPMKPSTGLGSHALRFRLIQSVDPTTGVPIYDDALRVYIVGPDRGTEPSAGLVLGRGPDLTTIHAAASGADGLLGTLDDNVSAVTGGVPIVELLVPDTYRPKTGEMFRIDVNGRLLMFTLRMNSRKRDGTFVFENDLVFVERVALRQ